MLFYLTESCVRYLIPFGLVIIPLQTFLCCYVADPCTYPRNFFVRLLLYPENFSLRCLLQGALCSTLQEVAAEEPASVLLLWCHVVQKTDIYLNWRDFNAVILTWYQPYLLQAVMQLAVQALVAHSIQLATGLSPGCLARPQRQSRGVLSNARTCCFIKQKDDAFRCKLLHFMLVLLLVSFLF